MRARSHTEAKTAHDTPPNYRGRLATLLQGELDFHQQPTGTASHGFHPFPARFPPQLARLFIDELTLRSDVVLDPMMGSGTTVVEAFLSARHAQGFDIDPLACLQTRVKTSPLPAAETLQQGYSLLSRARSVVASDPTGLEQRLAARFGPRTRKFVDFWFARDTQIELQALLEQIENVPCASTCAFLLLVFSATIITKSGGVSLAFDLAHTRPHRAKIVYSATGKLILEDKHESIPEQRARFLTKTLKSPVDEFRRRLELNVKGLSLLSDLYPEPRLEEANAQALPLEENSVDLIVTSPPYAANAIDYMRSHKFVLVWLGHAIEALGTKRNDYIGGDATEGFAFENVPPFTQEIISRLAVRDRKKARVLQRYYSEMKRVLREMVRVLRPGKAAILVVGSSMMRGMDTRTQHCLAEIGRTTGFEVPAIGVRQLDRNRRMMPVSTKRNTHSQIQQRMFEEYVIGFYKPVFSPSTSQPEICGN